MDIKITDKALRQFLDTDLPPEKLGLKVSLCGPTFDHIKKIDNDYLYEIEVITNRVDTASAQGIARESAAILNQMDIQAKLKNDPYKEKINLYPHLGKTFFFNIQDPDLVTQFVAVSLTNINVTDSPKDTQALLTASDERPINNIVDITNEITLLYGMPCHIFDLDKLAAQELKIRQSKAGETVKTLDDQENKLKGGDIVIEDGAGRLVDLCGIMGGAVAEVDKHTKNILLIVPDYQSKSIRRTSLYLQKRTLASQIYEKQPDPALCLPVLTKAIALFKERSGAELSSSVYVYNPQPTKPKTISLNLDWLNSFVGIDIPTKNTISILVNLGFLVTEEKNELICQVPSWRYHDINIKEDLAEEVARVYGYYLIPSKLPCVQQSPETKNIVLSLETKIKDYLSNLGYNEIYNSSLISQNLIEKTELKTIEHLDLKNALSEDYKYLRTSLVPSLLQNIKNNQGKIDESFQLYEISNVYHKNENKLPDENSTLSIASECDFRHAKGVVESLLEKINTQKVIFKKTSNGPVYFSTTETAEIFCDGESVGYLGNIKKTVLHQLGITSNPIIAEIFIPKLGEHTSEKYTYQPISEYPEISESITVKSKLTIGETISKISSVDKLIKKIAFTDQYQDKQTYKVFFGSMDKNLTQIEVNQIKTKIQELFD